MSNIVIVFWKNGDIEKFECDRMAIYGSHYPIFVLTLTSGEERIIPGSEIASITT